MEEEFFELRRLQNGRFQRNLKSIFCTITKLYFLFTIEYVRRKYSIAKTLKFTHYNHCKVESHNKDMPMIAILWCGDLLWQLTAADLSRETAGKGRKTCQDCEPRQKKAS